MDKAFELPKEFSSLENDLKAFIANLDSIDQTIENLPPDRGPGLNYNPPGFGKNTSIPREQRIKQLNEYKKELQSDMKERINSELKYADKATVEEVTLKSDVRIEQNPYLKISREEFETNIHQSKDLEQSQEYNKLSVIYHKYGKSDPNQDQGIEPEEDELGKYIKSFLNANQHPESRSEVTAPEIETTPNIENDPDGELEASMSSFMTRNQYRENTVEIVKKDQDIDPEP